MKKVAVIFSLIIWILGSESSVAEPPISEEVQVYEMDDLDKKPKPIKTVTPEYPKQEKKERINAHLLLEFVIDESGIAVEPTILEIRAGKGPSLKNSEDYEATHEIFSQSALEALAQWTFKPGIKDGVAVKTRVKLPLSYTLRR